MKHFFHVMIQTERRSEPRQLATVANEQLHTLGEVVNHLDDPNILYAAEWDQVSPWLVLHKGSITDLKMSYAGWPSVTKDEWDAANPPEVAP